MKKAVLVLSTILAFPCQAGELDDIAPSTQVYLRIPLGPAATARDRKPSFGLAIRNRYDGPAFMLDSRQVDFVLRSYEAGGVFAGIEAQWLVVGAVAAGAAVAVSARTKTESNQQQQQQQQKQQVQQQQQQQQQPQNQGPCTC